QTLALTAEQTRLPRDHTEGYIPLTAISTGQVDALECVLYKMGIKKEEFTNPSGGGRIHLYRATEHPGASGPAGGGTTPTDLQLVGGPGGTNRLSDYDMVVFPCQGTVADRSAVPVDNLRAYAESGGRVFLSHLSYSWLYNTAGKGT